MSNLLYFVAAILIIGWILGFAVFHVAGFLIHILLILAIIAIIVRVVNGRKN